MTISINAIDAWERANKVCEEKEASEDAIAQRTVEGNIVPLIENAIAAGEFFVKFDGGDLTYQTLCRIRDILEEEGRFKVQRKGNTLVVSWDHEGSAKKTRIAYEVETCCECGFCYQPTRHSEVMRYACAAADDRHIATIEYFKEMPSVPSWCPHRKN